MCVLLDAPGAVTVLVACPYANRLAGVIAGVIGIGSPTGFPDRLLGFTSMLGSDPSTAMVVIAYYIQHAPSMECFLSCT
jgi:hypothetical protein